MADEELALLSTQALVPDSVEGNEQVFASDSTRTAMLQGQKNSQPAQRPDQHVGPRCKQESLGDCRDDSGGKLAADS